MIKNGVITYEIALCEKPTTDGLVKKDIELLYGLVSNMDNTTEVYPIELEAKEHECSAMGFITSEAANILDFDYENSGLHDFIALILDDMENERPDHHYSFKGLDIYLAR